jgi:pilus assembly protein CpaC
MHRTNRVGHSALCGLMFCLVLGSRALGQAQPPQPVVPPGQGQPVFLGKTLIVPMGTIKTLQMSTKKRIQTVWNEREAVAKVSGSGDPTSVLISGVEPGITHITLVDENKNSETFEIQVQLDVEYLRTVLLKAVPTATVQVTPMAKDGLLITGVVARPEEADIVMKTAIGMAPAGAQVVNALRVGGVQQVQLDVTVAQVAREQFRALTFNFIEQGNHHAIVSNVGSAFSFTSSAFNFGSLNNTLTLGNPNGQPVNLIGTFFNPSQAFLAVMQALRNETVAKIVTEPRLVALSGKTASFLSGGEQAVPVPAGLGQVGVQFEEFGTRLNLLPIVLGNGKIHLEIEPEVSQLNAANGTSINGTTVPGRTTQRIHTTVELEDGQTYVLGGLIQREQTGNSSKVPILGDLPFIGAAFSSKSFDEIEEELVVMVTPHLVDAMACDQAPKVLPGEETRRPDDFELFLEGILEAPRGPREVFPGGKYVPAYKNSPTAALMPCAGGSPYAASGGAPACRTCQPAGAVIGVGNPFPDSPDVKPVGAEDVAPRTSDNPASPEAGKTGRR